MRAPFAIAVIATFQLVAGQDAAPKPQFEVASIRPGTQMSFAPENPERLVIRNMPLRSLIQRAYRLESYQLVGPEPLGTRWDVVATAAPGTTKDQTNLMLQSLLEERFHLTFHHGIKEFKAYDLTIAKGGLKLKESLPMDGCSNGAISVDGKACGPVSQQWGLAKGTRPGPMSAGTSPAGLSFGRNVDMALLARVIRQQIGDAPVIDKTGLTDVYDFRVQYSTISPITGRPFDEDSPLPAIFDALEHQLGLKLEPVKAMIETTIVDHVDAMPAEN